FVPDRIQGDAVFSACVIHGPVQDHVSSSIARPIVPSINRSAGLAAVKAWPGYDAVCRARAVPASLDRGCARRSKASRSGRRNALGRTKKLKCLLQEEFAAMPASCLPQPHTRMGGAKRLGENFSHPNPDAVRFCL